MIIILLFEQNLMNELNKHEKNCMGSIIKESGDWKFSLLSVRMSVGEWVFIALKIYAAKLGLTLHFICREP